MPELPDVEIYRRRLDANSLHKAVDHTHVHDESLLEGASRQKIAQALIGRPLDSTRRHGKYLGAHAAQGGWLLLHFGMTGDLLASSDGAPEHTALRLDFDDGSHLDFINRRRLGKIAWTDDFDDFLEREGLGPDAMSLELDAFRQMLDGRRGSIKSLLMNQSAVAGLGNVYTDETLFHAGVRPDRTAGKLSYDEAGAIHRAMRHILRTAIERGADPDDMPESWILPRRRENDPRCPGCDRALETATVGGRTTYWCRECQR